MRRRNKRLDQLRAMFARMQSERSGRDVAKVALGTGAALGAAYGVYKVAPKITRWGSLAKDVGKVGLGAGAVYGAYKAAPHVREYFSKENRTIRKIKRSMKDQTRLMKKADAYYRSTSQDLSELDPQTRNALFLAKTGNFLDTSSTRKYSKREFMHAMLRAHQADLMERRLADAMGEPRPDAIKPFDQMTEKEQNKAMDIVFKGRGLNPVTGNPVEESTSDYWNLRRSHEGSADLLKNRPRETLDEETGYPVSGSVGSRYPDPEDDDDDDEDKPKKKLPPGKVRRYRPSY